MNPSVSSKKNLFHNGTNVNEDDCAINAKDYQNISINDYHLWNNYISTCQPEGEKQLQQFATQHLNLNYKNGVGFTNSCHVEQDNEVRLNAKQTSEKARNQLFHRFYQNNPFLGKGKNVPNVESRLIQAEDTSSLKVCDRITEKDFDRFTPLVKCVRDTVQNPNTVVYPWTNGGDNSRLLMLDAQKTGACKHGDWKNVSKRQ